MRILSYNIWDGGGERLDEIASVIRAERPDAVALLEATAHSTAALGAALELEVAFGEGNSSFDTHVAWLSRPPIRQARNHRLPALANTLLELEISWNGAPLHLLATHLTSRHEEHAHPRAGEISAILEVLRDRADRAHLLVGDLNALAAGDPVGTPPSGVEPRGDAVPGAARTVLAPLAAAGYVDCYRSLHREPGYTYPADGPWLRLDYAFASPRLAPRVASCDVLSGARAASDHLPIYVELAGS